MNVLAPDVFCAAFSAQPEKLTIRLLDREVTLIEEKAEALAFLGNLLLVQAQNDRDCCS
jgi:hypothetical protein